MIKRVDPKGQIATFSAWLAMKRARKRHSKCFFFFSCQSNRAEKNNMVRANHSLVTDQRGKGRRRLEREWRDDGARRCVYRVVRHCARLQGDQSAPETERAGNTREGEYRRLPNSMSAGRRRTTANDGDVFFDGGTPLLDLSLFLPLSFTLTASSPNSPIPFFLLHSPIPPPA